jgi:murein DD-endopeptidase MepM/ murein hydrolase activator NlpD
MDNKLLKTNPKRIGSWFLTLLVLAVLAPIVWVLVVRLEGEKPAAQIQLASPYLGLSQELTVSFTDSKSGLRDVRIDIAKDGKDYVLVKKNFPGSGFIGGGEVAKESFTVLVEPKALGISEGKATLRIVAKDYSWRGRFSGNQTLIEKPVTIDTKPPAISVLTRFHNIAQGGAGLAIYQISEPCKETGIYVGEEFYPGYSGYFKDSNMWLAFFALRHDQDSKTKMFVQAVDAAGNRSVGGIPKHIIRKRFRKDRINISDGFLARKMPEFENQIAEGAGLSPVEIFLKVNRDFRKADYEKIVELVKNPDPALHWKGAFLRLPNSARRASFADYRDYRYQKKNIDNQVHLGIDLASLARSPVPASNAGKIAFSDRNGIYGLTVLIDHGFGLFSMYSHLSDIKVKKGQKVAKGDVIGNTGATGLAGGDHLHYSVLIHHTFVNPVEWWDGSWIENNVMAKIRDAETG